MRRSSHGIALSAKAKDLPLDSYAKGDKAVPYEVVVATVKGSSSQASTTKQLFPWVNPGEGAFRVIPGDYVTTDDGTGICSHYRHLRRRRLEGEPRRWRAPAPSH